MIADCAQELLGHYSSAYPYAAAAMGFDRRLSLAQVRRQWHAFLRASPFGGEVGLHVHIPYCRRRCTYCDCSSQPLRSPARLAAHLERLRAEMRYLRDTFGAVRMSRLYVGGGTPNLLSPAQPQRLAADVDSCFRLRPDAVHSIEFAPELTSAVKLEAARAGGFNRLSFGVQTLNPRVLAAVGRPGMSAAKAGRAVRAAHAAGFAEINVDLIFGLAGERTRSFHRALREVGRWGPHTVTVQLLANSELGTAYRSRGHERAVARRFVGYAEQLESRLAAALPGYCLALRPRTLVLVHEGLRRPWESWLDFYSGQDRVVTSTLGLGTFAQSRMHAAWHMQNMDHLSEFDPEARHYQGRRYTPELEAAIDAAAALMIEGRCDLALLRRRYGRAAEPLERELGRLVDQGNLARSGGRVSARGGRKNPLLPLVRDLSQGSAADARDRIGPATDPRLATQGRLVQAPESKLRVLLLSKINETRQAALAPRATAAKALGAWCLQTYVEAQPDLRDRVDIEVRSALRDTPMNRLFGLVLQLRPDVLGLTCQVWNHEDLARLSALVLAALPDTFIVHGGPMVVQRRRYLERLGPRTLHVAAEGYGEELFADLLRSRLDGAPRCEEIQGIAYFDEDGEARVTADRAAPALAAMPPVITARNLETLGSYALYETARGCPFGCKFCNWGTHRIQYRAPEVIERDLAALLGHPGVETLWIVDSAIDIRRSHARFLADVIRRHRRRPVRVVGYVFLKAPDLSFVEDLVGAFDTLQLGLQTADPQVLGDLGRGGLQVERFDAMFDAVLPHYPGLRVDLMYGLPGLRLAELQASVRALLQRSIRFLNLFRLVSIPGTEMAERRADYGILAEDWPPYEVYAAAGVSPGEMFRMLRFKESMDVLRPVFATGCYAEALRGGVDLVDFASSLPAASPALMEAISFQDEHDAALSADTIGLVLEAAERYTTGSGRRRDLLLRLLREGYASMSSGASPARGPAAAPAPGGRRSGRAPVSPSRCLQTAAPGGSTRSAPPGGGDISAWSATWASTTAGTGRRAPRARSRFSSGWPPCSSGYAPRGCLPRICAAVVPGSGP